MVQSLFGNILWEKKWYMHGLNESCWYHGLWWKIIVLHFQLERSYQRFTAFYGSRHSGRKLNWLYQRSKGEIVTNCFKNRYTLQASTFQIAVLLQYNAEDSHSVQQLQETTLIKMDILTQVLQILLKSKLLVTSDGGSETEIKPETQLSLFRNYKK